ncbi:MAG: lipase family protein [Solirubrobacteraceae bacterium]|nr:lipase family protein [Solirubrobacteraceae bacterium]
MYRIVKSRLVRATAATLAGLAFVAVSPVTASAATSPAIDWNVNAPTPNADADPFYTPPSTIPTGNPGDIIRARVANAGPPTARSLAKAWQVMYLSTDALGNPNVVTGTIMVPKNGASTAPLVTIAPGTTGPAFRCTVSRFINSGAFYEQPAVNDMLKAGYAVAVTDYEGYHENPKTTYVAGRSMGAAVLNISRAATRLPEAGLSPTPKLAIRGYSQGGGAAMWAGQMAPTYAPELNIVGIAGGGVPANLALVAASLQGQPAFGFLLNAMIGLDNAYPELVLDDFLTDVGKSTIANMVAGDCTIELLIGYENKKIDDYATESPFSTAPWLDRIDPENKLGATKINVPVFQYHANNDPIVSPRGAANLRKAYCALGVDLQWKEFDGTGHITTVARGNADVAAFIAARFRGATTAPNCSAI